MMALKTTQKDTILIVDDIFDNLIAAQAILEEEGYEIRLEEDSITAFEQVKNSPPDLLLLDVMMPELDGYEFTRRIRQDTTLPFIPILLVTAHDESNVVEGLNAGADDFIRKPVNPDELQARVRCLLRLKHSIDERDRMTKLREDFVSRFAHDLKIPLAASNRILQLMVKGQFFEVTPELREILQNMITSNGDLLTMVQNMLEVYKFEAGCKSFNFVKCNLTDLVQSVGLELAPLAVEKNLQLTIDLPTSEKIEVSGDRIELRRVLTNIIGNGIKFTPKGGVTVRLQVIDGKAVVEIEDTGVGISPEEKTRLFERFRQGKKQGTGSGLGLYLSRCIIESHQGEIHLSSELGQGSKFTILLPIIPPEVNT
ncbi:hybrid sensor histidine kinase/response regulator [Calothrix sp. NIES-3974]|uniref:hybrid sensor histidine kinase/response regulator n=1 Tax=Calothrix sp. NIES-3974 TaxID=2005462 RepID=UPI000B61FF49|nr:hybrid sensor histidine kinase/response regulator [Calothrix sp. NIES-3974]BAZ07364.1 response regulator receiver sensor signal transduction histidine kinase [Calothrix sp. NIES-3974]